MMDQEVDKRGFIVIKVKGLPVCTICGNVRYTAKWKQILMTNLCIKDKMHLAVVTGEHRDDDLQQWIVVPIDSIDDAELV